jgi:hypothetical protein
MDSNIKAGLLLSLGRVAAVEFSRAFQRAAGIAGTPRVASATYEFRRR